MKRLVRFASLAAAVAAVIAAIRALNRDHDPLPAPASGPTGSPWPPLRAEPTTTTPVGDATPTPDAAPAPNPPVEESREVVVPEPDGIPVAAVEDAPAPSGAWTEPTATGGCPEGYPIKAKMTSKIFHAPGQLNYERTTPDRCYASAEAAEADGLRAAKR